MAYDYKGKLDLFNIWDYAIPQWPESFGRLGFISG